MTETGLVDKYPEQLHERIIMYLISIQHICRHELNYMLWIVNYIRKQKNHPDLTVETLSEAIDCAPHKIRHYGSHQGLEIQDYASVPYIDRKLGSGLQTLLMTQAQAMLEGPGAVGCLDGFANHEALTIFLKNAAVRATIEPCARSLYMLDLMAVSDLEVSLKYHFMAAIDGSRLSGWESTFYLVATDLTLYCLTNNMTIETVWDTWRGQWYNQTIWEFCNEPTDRPHIEPLLSLVFSKQKLLYNYLLACTPQQLQELCSKHPDVARILTGHTGKIPTTRKQKLKIANSWISPLLLDLLEVDVSTINDLDCVGKLIVPEQYSSQELSIEI